jgi:ubiquinone/menaquinone biosynthesis C-methylase UbiE
MLQRKNGEFDCLFLLEVLEHLANVDLALKELFRVSRNYVVISVPHEPIWSILNILRLKYLKSVGNTPDHINHWSPASIKRLFSRYGKIEKTYLSLPWIIVLAKKINDS